jgi:hypothetical protein
VRRSIAARKGPVSGERAHGARPAKSLA